jgi:hypothetical protein
MKDKINITKLVKNMGIGKNIGRIKFYIVKKIT